MPRVISTAVFLKCLEELRKKGKPGKIAISEALAAQAEFANTGKTTLRPTSHGESRLPDIEKYELANGAYRLVTQRVQDGNESARAFLYAADHKETDRWLDNHKGYVWTKRENDNRLTFVQVTETTAPASYQPRANVESPAHLQDLPLLRELTPQQWEGMRISDEVREYAMTITSTDWACDATGVYEYIEAKSPPAANLLLDLFDHAHRREWDALRRRVELECGQAHVAQSSEVLSAMIDPVNSETFVTWEEVDQLPKYASWSEWMLFLHPRQKELAHEDFAGPARLRGVSGSGKTCVMIHRARYLAKKYGQKVLLVTLTESMRKLLDALIRDLCGVEISLIETSVMNRISEWVIERLHPRGINCFTRVTDAFVHTTKKSMIELVRSHAEYNRTPFKKMSQDELWDFLAEEMCYIRTRLCPSDYELYLNVKTFPRHGRGTGLSEAGRHVCLDAVRYWDGQLRQVHMLDFEGIVQMAALLVRPDQQGLKSVGLNDLDMATVLSRLKELADSCHGYRCVLVDEVQDLSQVELSVLALLPWGNDRVRSLENGLFLVGDGAQTVYRKGFSLQKSEITLNNRSFVLKKNYRNSREILTAAYRLIQEYEFADVDEDNIQRPTEPDLAVRQGERPIIVKCNSVADQTQFVVEKIGEILEQQRLDSEAEEYEEQAPPQICIIGFNAADRERAGRSLDKAGIAWAQLRQDVDFGGNVKISTVESAKGHEFQHVFILNVVERVIPRSAEPEDIPHDAARLYVAMTRARDTLWICYSSTQYNTPSRYLTAIQTACQEMEYVNGKLREIK